jgi:hypothetical protein
MICFSQDRIGSLMISRSQYSTYIESQSELGKPISDGMVDIILHAISIRADQNLPETQRRYGMGSISRMPEMLHFVGSARHTISSWPRIRTFRLRNGHTRLVSRLGQVLTLISLPLRNTTSQLPIKILLWPTSGMLSVILDALFLLGFKTPACGRRLRLPFRRRLSGSVSRSSCGSLIALRCGRRC